MSERNMVTLAQKRFVCIVVDFFSGCQVAKICPKKMLIAFKLPNTLPMFNEKQQNFVSTNAS
jgi:hypothetical protein